MVYEGFHVYHTFSPVPSLDYMYSGHAVTVFVNLGTIIVLDCL